MRSRKSHERGSMAAVAAAGGGRATEALGGLWGRGGRKLVRKRGTALKAKALASRVSDPPAVSVLTAGDEEAVPAAKFGACAEKWSGRWQGRTVALNPHTGEPEPLGFGRGRVMVLDALTARTSSTLGDEGTVAESTDWQLRFEAPPADDGAPGRCRPPARRGPLRADARHGRPSTLCTIVNQLQIIPTILNRHQLQINGRTTRQIK